MKKLTILAIIFIVFSGVSVASSYQVKQDNKPKTTKKPVKKEVKKVPHRTTVKKNTAKAPNTTKQ